MLWWSVTILPIILLTRKKNFQTTGSYWRQVVRGGGWRCTNLIFLAKIFPDTSVDKSCICLKYFSTRALMYLSQSCINDYKQHINYSVFFKVPDTVFTELSINTGISWKMVNWQTTIDRKYWWTDSHLTEKKKKKLVVYSVLAPYSSTL